jgi:hypothetical protein
VEPALLGIAVPCLVGGDLSGGGHCGRKQRTRATQGRPAEHVGGNLEYQFSCPACAATSGERTTWLRSAAPLEDAGRANVPPARVIAGPRALLTFRPFHLVATALPAGDRAVAPFDGGSHHATVVSWALLRRSGQESGHERDEGSGQPKQFGGMGRSWLKHGLQGPAILGAGLKMTGPHCAHLPNFALIL